MKKKNLHIAEMFELPKEITKNLPVISIIGCEELFLENYKGIIEYTDDKIRINTTAGVLKIEGKGMSLKQLTEENISIAGRITSMEYLY